MPLQRARAHIAPYDVLTRRRARRALARHARRLVANHCTPIWTTTQCNCPRREQSKESIACELHCPSTTCEHMRQARTSAPYGVQACHACTHLQRPGGLPPIPMACSASKLSDAAPCHQPRSVGVVELSCVEREPAGSRASRVASCRDFEVAAPNLRLRSYCTPL